MDPFLNYILRIIEKRERISFDFLITAMFSLNPSRHQLSRRKSNPPQHFAVEQKKKSARASARQAGRAGSAGGIPSGRPDRRSPGRPSRAGPGPGRGPLTPGKSQRLSPVTVTLRVRLAMARAAAGQWPMIPGRRTDRRVGGVSLRACQAGSSPPPASIFQVH